MRNVISEKEFDTLPELTQMRYLFCPVCKMFYLISEGKCHSCTVNEV
jgi:hypothetical protein